MDLRRNRSEDDSKNERGIMNAKTTAADFLNDEEIDRAISERGVDPARIPCRFIKTHTDGPEHFRVFDEIEFGPVPDDIRTKINQPVASGEILSLYGYPAQQVYRQIVDSDW